MSTRDYFKNSVLEAFGQVDPAKIGLSLFVALAMGILIYYVYKRFFTGVVYSRSFAVTLVGMCVLTCMVTLAISTNVVISLGMVGALSIVRYRTAVKDPLDLLYLFWAITTGITAGAGMYALVGLTAVVIVAMIAGFASHQDKARVYMMVIHYTGQTTGDDIVRAFGRTKFTVKSKTMRGDKVEMAVEVFSDGVEIPTLPDTVRAVRVSEDLMRSVSPMETPQGALFTVALPETKLPETLAGKHYLVLDGVQDPGNVGTILRTADAFECDGVFLVNACADLFNPKTARATMGAIFRREAYSVTPEELFALLSKSGVPLYGTALREDTVPLSDANLSKAAVAIGSEGRGLSQQMLDECAKTLKIPMSPRCESLNAAIAATVVLWEMYR